MYHSQHPLGTEPAGSEAQTDQHTRGVYAAQHDVAKNALICMSLIDSLCAPDQARVAELAGKLRARLERYVAGDAEGFVREHAQEAGRLAEASFGEAMLHTIG